MKKKVGAIRSLVAATVMAAFAGSAVADTIDEVEPNSPVASAQPLVFDTNGVAVVNAFLGSGDGDVFSFQAQANDVVTVDIDGGAKGGGAGHVDTFVTVLNLDFQGHQVMREGDDSAPDEGSIGTEDSYIPNIAIETDGTYYVGVAGFPNRVADGGVLAGGPGNLTGSYTLIVTLVRPIVDNPVPESDPDPETQPEPETQPDPPTGGEQPPVSEQPVDAVTISIDIKPGVRRIAKVDPKSRREVPVALLGARNFDVRKVDVNSLTFGATGDEQSLKRCSRHYVRVNRDRRRDLICFFENREAGFETTDLEGVLKGKTVDGESFIGRGRLKVIAEKRNNHRHRHDGRDDDRRKRRR